VQTAGVVRCGIDAEEAEYSTTDDHGNRAAFDGDLCRAVAAAVGVTARETEYPDDQTAMKGLNTGEVDLIATLPDDFSHSAATRITLTRPVLWDGVGFLAAPGSTVTRAHELSGKKICFLAETTAEESVRAWFQHEHLNFVPFPFQEEGEMQAAFTTGNCGALVADRTRLAADRVAVLQRGKRTRLLPERISKDPLAAAVREDDRQWAAIVNWVMEALVEAEENGVTQANVATKRTQNDPVLRFLLGGSHEIGAKLGLYNDWVVRAIEATGNYGEIYERDLGSGSALKLARGENNLHALGGLMMALPAK
jgi:general L-amino acid transport system substrate-binding protein